MDILTSTNYKNMRILIRFSENKEPVPVVNQDILNTYIHKCLGANNEYHDSKNDYCISHLYGGKMNEDKTISFNNGGYICVTSKNESFLNRLISGVLKNTELSWGMKFKTFDFISEKFIGSEMKKQENVWHHFATLSPFIIKKYIDKKTYTFATLDDDNFSEEVKQHMINKLTKIYHNIDLTGFDIKIENRPTNKIKRILVKNVINKANQCQISIFCKANVAEKIYNLGIGQSTGSGFGTIYKTENHSKYRLGIKK